MNVVVQVYVMGLLDLKTSNIETKIRRPDPFFNLPWHSSSGAYVSIWHFLGFSRFFNVPCCFRYDFQYTETNMNVLMQTIHEMTLGSERE